jgi:hypothetical protein
MWYSKIKRIQNVDWRNRIVGQGSQPADQFQANPLNWRLHPTDQRKAVKGSLDTLGWIQQVIVNQSTGHLIDGHERVWQALDNNNAEVPFIMVDLSEDEERQALATLDPLSNMAAPDYDKFAELTQGLETGNAALDQLIADIAAGNANTSGKGEALDLTNITIADPGHEVNKGDVWSLGDHTLICADVLTGWPLWKRFLDGENTVFCPYPGPYAPLTEKAGTKRLILVQPDPYIPGHIIDRYVEVKGSDGVEKTGWETSR